MSEGAPKFPSENEASAAANNAANVLVCEESAPPISEQKSPTSSEPKSPASTKSDSKETKPTGIKAPAASKIGRLCQAHQAPKTGPPPLEQKSKFYRLMNDLRSLIFCCFKHIRYISISFENSFFEDSSVALNIWYVYLRESLIVWIHHSRNSIPFIPFAALTACNIYNLYFLSSLYLCFI